MTAPVPGRRLLHRSVDVDAAPETVWRWVRQLQVAPYSYDLIDNLGRRSPRSLQDVPELAVGQRFVKVLTLTEVTSLSVTGTTRPVPVLGSWTMTCEVQPRPGRRSRLVVRIELPVRTRVQRLLAWPLAAGDLVMVRKQLRTLRDLAQLTEGAPPAPG